MTARGAATPPSRLLTMRVFYFLSFGALGALFPYLPLLLSARGLDAAQISWVMVLIPAGALVLPPLWGMAADKLDNRLQLLRAASCGCAACVLLLYPRLGLPGSLLAVGAFSLFRAPLTSLADAATSSALGAARASFGHVRVWGSVGFAVFALAVGQLQVSRHPALLVGVAAVAYAGSAASLLRLPAAARPGDRAVVGETLRIAAGKPILLFLAGTVCYYAGHSTYDAFFSLHASRLGHGDRFIGAAWATGVGVEICLMMVGPALLRRVRSQALLVCCAAAAALRWLLISRLTGSWLIPTQALHGVTFGLWYLAGIQFVQERAPDHLRTSLQAVAVASMGLGQVTGYLAGGMILHRVGGAALYQAAAAASGVALALYLLCGLTGRRDP